MGYSKELYNLIKSLNKTEKRYFKLYVNNSSNKTTSNYLNLFTAIDKQDEYDEKYLRNNFKKKGYKGQFHVTKNYLYNLILDSLNSYHKLNSARAQTFNLIQSAEILYQKGLYNQSLKLVEKSKKNAIKYQLFETIPSIHRVEYEIHMKQLNFDETINSLKEESNYRKLYEYELKYKFLLAEVYEILTKKGLARNDVDIKRLDEIVNDSIFKDKKSEELFMASYYRYTTLIFDSYLRRNMEKSNYWLKETINYFEKYPSHIQNNLDKYTALIHNYCVALLSIDIDGIPKLLTKFRSIPKNYKKYCSIETQGIIEMRALNIELTYYYQKNQFSKINEFEETVISVLDKYSKTFDLRLKQTITYYTTLLFFYDEKYSKSLQWVNKLLDSAKNTVGDDLISMGKILNIIIHYELKNFELLEYLIINTDNRLKKKVGDYNFEELILTSLKAQVKAKGKKEMMNDFLLLKEKIRIMEEDPKIKNMFAYFNLKCWIESKVQGIPLKEVPH